MIGQLIEKTVKYTDVVLPVSGVKVSGIVNIRDGKLFSTEGNIYCGYEKFSFSFSLNQSYHPAPIEDGEETVKEPVLNVSNWPFAVSVDKVRDEFVAYVNEDVK